MAAEEKTALHPRQGQRARLVLMNVETLLPKLISERKSVLSSGFIFQEDDAPAHRQSWLKAL